MAASIRPDRSADSAWFANAFDFSGGFFFTGSIPGGQSAQRFCVLARGQATRSKTLPVFLFVSKPKLFQLAGLSN